MKKVEYLDSLKKNKADRRDRIYRAYRRRNLFFKFGPVLLLFMFNKNLLINLIIGALWIVFHTMFFDHSDIYPFRPSCSVWFGVPGSGKTTMASLLSRASRKFGYKVLSNFELKEAYRLDVSDLGNIDMSFDGEGCHVLLDEGQLDFDNRNYMNFAKSAAPKYFSLHRHMNNRVDVFSQGYDIDKRIRDRCGSNGLFYLKRFPIKGFVYYRHIKKVLFINKEDKQMIDGFEFQGLPRIVYSKSVWGSFDTLDLSMCPKDKKEWALWSSDEEDYSQRNYSKA